MQNSGAQVPDKLDLLPKPSCVTLSSADHWKGKLISV